MMNLIEELYKLALRRHYVCDEDCWYSCPASGESCGEDGFECNCGADAHNARVEEIFSKIIEERNR